MIPTNPFIISGYAGEDTFCDRVEETSRLISLLLNGHNVVLSSARRIGKSDLIQHVFAQPQIAQEYITINVDIYATQNFSEFVLFLSKAITDALKPRGKRLVDAFLKFLQSLRSEFTFDANGMPVWSLGIGQATHPDVTLQEIFGYIAQSKKQCIVAIDEFQQILRYPDASRVEALLRTYIQKMQNARFIFSGSQQHLMAEIFLSPSRPFYQQTTMMSLPLIPLPVYTDFCLRLFAQGNKQVLPEVVAEVYQRFHGVTAYMQRMMNELYASTLPGAVCQAGSVQQALKMILDQANDGYEALLYQLSERQRATMLAIAAEGEVANYASSEFVKKYDLVSASSIRSSINTLLDRELLAKTPSGIIVYDRFFALWLLRRFQN